MDYHKDRFEDCSLMLEDKGHLIAVFPANFVVVEKNVSSHAGLTYGGLIASSKATARQVLDAFDAVTSFYRRELSAETLFYKPVPHIYHRYPSEEELYALFLHHAELVSRAISSTIPLSSPLPLRQGRMEGVRKARKQGFAVKTLLPEDDDMLLKEMWDVLTENLYARHQAHPVHSYEEIRLLARLFPKNIHTHIVTSAHHIVGGCVVFTTETTAHVQYITSTPLGREHGAVDLLFATLIPVYASQCRYFDFGISTENNGRLLNEGLLSQKEGFGARCICYDMYKIKLN